MPRGPNSCVARFPRSRMDDSLNNSNASSQADEQAYGRLVARLITLLAAWSMFVASAGCQTNRGFRPADLPPQFQAPIVRSTQNLDLSRLARVSSGGQVIQPGDVLDVVLATGYEKTEPTKHSLRVADNGTVNVPLVGPVQVAGMIPSGAENAIGAESVRRSIYRKPQVTVQWGDRQTHLVTVTGAVTKPGVYRLPVGSSDLLAALVYAEGLSEEADTMVEIRHPAAPFDHVGPQGFPVEPASYQPGWPAIPPRTVHVDLLQASLGSPVDLHLEDGSVVVVRKKMDRSVYVMGLVNQAGQFEMPPDQELRLLDALAMAEGRKFEVADKVSIIRNNPTGPEPITIAASVREAKRNRAANISLAPGDVISVEETPTTIVVDTVRNVFRFGFSAAIPGF